jgi:exosortase
MSEASHKLGTPPGEVASGNSRSDRAPSTASTHAWVRWLPVLIIFAWWLRDLSFQWASLVEYRFGWIVVMLMAYLIWERWPTRPKENEDTPSAWGWSLAWALVGFPMVLVAELYKIGVARVPSSSFVLSLGCTCFVIACILQIAGPRTLRHFLFPLLFLYVAVPLPKLFWNPIVFSLQSFVTMLNVETLNLLGIPAQRQGYTIRLPNTVVGVDEACSGVRSLQSSIMAALFIGDLVLRNVRWKIFFLIAGIVLAIIGNFGRSLYLSLTAHRGGPEALDAVHDTAGWSVLLFTAVGVSALAWIVSRLEQPPPMESDDAENTETIEEATDSDRASKSAEADGGTTS